jgi:hypothetical protein
VVGVRSRFGGTLFSPGALCEKAGVAAKPTPKITAAVKADFFLPIVTSFELNNSQRCAQALKRNGYASTDKYNFQECAANKIPRFRDSPNMLRS